MLADDVITVLVGGGLGTAGSDLLIGALPPSPDVVTVVTETPGFAPTYAQGADAPAFETPRFQLRTRGAPNDYQAPRLRIERAYQLLAARPAGAVNGTPYAAWIPVQTPGVFAMDDNRRWIFYVNFEAWKELTTL